MTILMQFYDSWSLLDAPDSINAISPSSVSAYPKALRCSTYVSATFLTLSKSSGRALHKATIASHKLRTCGQDMASTSIKTPKGVHPKWKRVRNFASALALGSSPSRTDCRSSCHRCVCTDTCRRRRAKTHVWATGGVLGRKQKSLQLRLV